LQWLLCRQQCLGLRQHGSGLQELLRQRRLKSGLKHGLPDLSRRSGGGISWLTRLKLLHL